MTRTDKLAILEDWQSNIIQTDETFEKLLEPLMLSPESPLYEAIWRIQEAYTKAVARLVGDKDEWLDWYRNENKMGDNGYACCPGAEKPSLDIDVVEDLLCLIEESK